MFTQLQHFCQPHPTTTDDTKAPYPASRSAEEEAVDREREERVMEVYEDVLSAFEALLGKCGGEVYGVCWSDCGYLSEDVPVRPQLGGGSYGGGGGGGDGWYGGCYERRRRRRRWRVVGR